ncbi:MAG: hypothetical protein IPH32_09720 [Bacteroidetes bacterium]|nr:hypothetical protein [Bacteroidota bacterium]
MKKITLFTIALVSAILFHNKILAQDNSAFDKGTVVATAGYGFPDFYRTSLRVSYNAYSSRSVRGFGPIILKGDYGIVKFKWGHSVGAGIVIGYSNTRVNYTYIETKWNNGNGWNNYTYSQTDNYQTITIGARGSYHFFTKEKVDCYANVGLGFNINTSTHTTDNPNGYTSYAASRSGLYNAFTVGIRYYFTKNIGVYSELGWDNSTPIQGGVAIKF